MAGRALRVIWGSGARTWGSGHILALVDEDRLAPAHGWAVGRGVSVLDALVANGPHNLAVDGHRWLRCEGRGERRRAHARQPIGELGEDSPRGPIEDRPA